MFLFNCPETPAVRELKSKDRIEGLTLSSIKLRFQMAKLVLFAALCTTGASQRRDECQSTRA
jgi:hypothetical protein